MEIPKTQENIKLFELKKDSLSEEKEGQKNPSDSLKMEILQTAERSKKKKKGSKKHEDEHRVFPDFPGKDDGRESFPSTF